MRTEGSDFLNVNNGLSRAWTRWGHTKNLSEPSFNLLDKFYPSPTETNFNNRRRTTARKYRNQLHKSKHFPLDLQSSTDENIIQFEKDIQRDLKNQQYSQNEDKKNLPKQLELSTRPNSFFQNLNYDHLALNSLEAIESIPMIKIPKEDSYLANWWINAKKWELLSDSNYFLNESSGSPDAFISKNLTCDSIDMVTDLVDLGSRVIDSRLSNDKKGK